MTNRPTLIQLQDKYVAAVLNAGNSLKRIRIARDTLISELRGMGYTVAQAKQIRRDAHDIACLEWWG